MILDITKHFKDTNKYYSLVTNNHCVIQNKAVSGENGKPAK